MRLCFISNEIAYTRHILKKIISNYLINMGSSIEINDTLQITRAQGFPKSLVYETHKNTPYTAKQFAGQVFTFESKAGIRIYKTPPVRNFLVENIDGKWLYWGLVHIVSLSHDNIKKTTSGTFVITYIYTPEEMKQAHQLIDRRDEISYH